MSSVKKIRWRDLAERAFWTFVSSVATELTGAVLLDIDPWKSALLTGLNSTVTFVLVVARQRLKVLPDPGEGLPGLPT